MLCEEGYEAARWPMALAAATVAAGGFAFFAWWRSADWVMQDMCANCLHRGRDHKKSMLKPIFVVMVMQSPGGCTSPDQLRSHTAEAPAAATPATPTPHAASRQLRWGVVSGAA